MSFKKLLFAVISICCLSLYCFGVLPASANDDGYSDGYSIDIKSTALQGSELVINTTVNAPVKTSVMLIAVCYAYL